MIWNIWFCFLEVLELWTWTLGKEDVRMGHGLNIHYFKLGWGIIILWVWWRSGKESASRDQTASVLGNCSIGIIFISSCQMLIWPVWPDIDLSDNRAESRPKVLKVLQNLCSSDSHYLIFCQGNPHCKYRNHCPVGTGMSRPRSIFADMHGHSSGNRNPIELKHEEFLKKVALALPRNLRTVHLGMPKSMIYGYALELDISLGRISPKWKW